jgi:lipopolysaccharide biosynthesis glycosyltransferase
MKHITLASDTKYLLFAVTLIRSVQKHSSIPLTFHYYCMDQNTFEKIQKIQLTNGTEGWIDSNAIKELK